MAQSMTSTRGNRFVNINVSELQQANRSPISGYEHLPVMSLEEAVESIVPFVPHVKSYAKDAKERCRQNTTLTRNESAAIYLYTMDAPFFPALNEALRAENRQALKPWFAFLKLFITALEKLPSRPITMWRGVADKAHGSGFVKLDMHTWWSVNSCSSYVDVAGIYVGPTGTLFCINAIRGKNITEYSAYHTEEEVILMPGTCLCVASTLSEPSGRSIVHLEECDTVPDGKHVMLSYNSSSQDIISKVHHILHDGNIPVWFDACGDMTDSIYESLAYGVENATVVCCFMTPDYQKSEICRLQLQYAQKRHKRIIPCMLSDTNVWKPCDWLEQITRKVAYIDFHDDVSESKIHSKTRELIVRIKEQPSASQYLRSQPVGEPSYLFELIKYEYLRNSRIKRIVNVSKSFPIDDSYINLAIVETKEQQQKEKKLRDTHNNDAIINTFEDIYGTKTAVDVKDIFKTCKSKTKQVLVLGRAGIGKSTFCRYVAYQWAKGVIWPEFDLVILVPLRSLTADRYPSGTRHTLVDLVKNEYFYNQVFSEQEENLLKSSCDKNNVLWLLDGYDEIAGNVPTHLEILGKQLLETTHHILTSRPYAITLAYNVKMEIIGFTDTNIPNYIKQFFDSVKDELETASIQNEKLLFFLKHNPRIWGVAHIPVNLELICSLWGDTDWSETMTLTMTTLYDEMTEWLCRRYSTKQDPKNFNMVKDEVHKHCKNELTFLETLAFLAMKKKNILLQPELLRETEKKSNWSLKDHPELLNIGILKSFNDKATGSHNDREINHYFVHLSFQEFFAARYIVNALHGDAPQEAIQFIKDHKYNHRFSLLLSFASGLLIHSNNATSIDTFWNTILGEPLDLVGIRHMQILISCLEETDNQLNRRTEFMNDIIRCIRCAVDTKNTTILSKLKHALHRCPSIVNSTEIMDSFSILLQTTNTKTKQRVLQMISELQTLHPKPHLLSSLLTALGDADVDVRSKACDALAQIGKKALTNDVIKVLVTTLGDADQNVRWHACLALTEIGEKVATNDVSKALITALGNADDNVRSLACKALTMIAERAATNEFVQSLVTGLGNADVHVRSGACEALVQIGEKAATNDVIKALVTTLGDADVNVRSRSCAALGRLGEKAATNDVIMALVTTLGDADENVKWHACQGLVMIGEKAATNDVIKALVTAFVDAEYYVSRNACDALARMREKAATDDVIKALVADLRVADVDVRSRACEALAMMGEKAATKDVIKALVTTLGDTDVFVSNFACVALTMIGEKAVTNDVIKALVTAFVDTEYYVSRNACEALAKIDEKAVTNDAIHALMIALWDADVGVRNRVCDALDQIGEKAVAKNVIDALVTALGGDEVHFRNELCEALANIGEKAATNDVIKALVIALGDANFLVRGHACKALGKIGEKAATNDVIKALVTMLGDANVYVSRRACTALGRMGERAITNDAIKALVTALGDADVDIRRRACTALDTIGEKAASNDVIKALMTALGDADVDVRSKACDALGQMGKKALTNDVIKALVTTLGDADVDVRSRSCEALRKMSDKAATNDVIKALVTTLGNANEYIRSNTCQALAEIGEKAATNDVNNALVIALSDVNFFVRIGACETLAKMGEKAATDNVIKALVTALRGADVYFRRYICEALLMMGDKVATDDVVKEILGVDEQGWMVNRGLQKIVHLWSASSHLDRNAFSNLMVFCRKHGEEVLKDAHTDKLIKACMEMGMTEWCPIISTHCISTGIAITVLKNTLIVYGNNEPIHLAISDSSVCDNLVHSLVQQRSGLLFFGADVRRTQGIDSEVSSL